MDDSTTPRPTPPVAMPNPHGDEPTPSPQAGMRPEAAANPEIRPEQDEPGGPLAGLVGTAATQAATEAAPANADAELLEKMGVENEGIESGQLLGLVTATIFAVAGLAVVLIYLFYLPFRQQVGTQAGDVSDYPELEQSRTEALAKLNQFARTDSLYNVPINQAMSVVAGRYAASSGAAGSAAPAGLPATRQQWNTLMLNRGIGTAIQNPTGRPRRTTVEQERLAATSSGAAGAARTATGSTQGQTPAERIAPGMTPRTPGMTNEEVGVDDSGAEQAPTTLGDAQHDG